MAAQPSGTRARPRGLLARTWAPLLVAAGGLAATAVVAVRDPHVPGSYGHCIVHLTTGWYCPGCGGLRAVHHVAHGDVLAAVQSNAFGLLMCALLVAIWFGWFTGQRRGVAVNWDRWFTPRLAWTFAGLLVFFSVFRNTPWGWWLAPPG